MATGKVKSLSPIWTSISGGYALRYGDICYVFINNNNAAFTDDGIQLPYKSNSKVNAICKYFDGTSDISGIAFIDYNTDVLKIRKFTGGNVSGSYLAVQFAYAIKE